MDVLLHWEVKRQSVHQGHLTDLVAFWNIFFTSIAITHCFHQLNWDVNIDYEQFEKYALLPYNPAFRSSIFCQGQSWLLMSQPRPTRQRPCKWYLCQSLVETITRSFRQVIISYFAKFLCKSYQNMNSKLHVTLKEHDVLRDWAIHLLHVNRYYKLATNHKVHWYIFSLDNFGINAIQKRACKPLY